MHSFDFDCDDQGLFWNFAPEAYPDGYIPHAPNGGFYHWSR